MNDLLIGLCTYLSLGAQSDQACRVTINQAYNISSVKPLIDTQQAHLEKQGLALYSALPLHDLTGAISLLAYEAYKKDFKLPLTNNINLEYNGSYICNLH